MEAQANGFLCYKNEVRLETAPTGIGEKVGNSVLLEDDHFACGGEFASGEGIKI